MEDLAVKTFLEFGALGGISFYLLTRGTSAIKELADSNKLLADSVTKLSDKVNSLDSRQTSSEYELRSIGERLDKIESILADLMRGKTQ